MTNRDRFSGWFPFRAVFLLLLAGAGCIALQPVRGAVLAAPLQPNGFQQGSGFQGPWCAQGDTGKRTSIAPGGGGFLQLTNESGDTSVGILRGPNQIVAPQWQFVSGALSGDGNQINWSNGTFWARCDNGGGGDGDGYPRIRLTGTWFANGDRSRACSIRQHHDQLSLQNESGQSGSGSFVGRHHITTNWNGTPIRGTITHDGNRINWDNGTYWIRDRLYTQ